MAAISAANMVFSTTKIQLCVFHFGQNNWRQIQSLDLFSLYKSNIEIKKIIRMMLNLIFVQKECVMNEFNRIKNLIKNKNLSNELDKFLIYFESTYIGEYQNGVESKKPLYPIKFWSANARVRNNVCRTTNSVESWHKSIKNKLVLFILTLVNFSIL
jgi:hypothetical protein